MTLVNPFPEPQMRKIEITPMQDGQSLTWRCPKCRIMNELLKSQIGENRLYPCDNDSCDYQWVLGILPDDMRHWLNAENPGNIDQRPRIIGR